VWVAQAHRGVTHSYSPFRALPFFE
jgi:hypothetical protein